MPKVEMSRTHDFSLQEARAKVEKIGNRLAEKHGLSGGWKSEQRYEFKRTGAKGSVFLEEGKVTVTVELSMLLSALKSKVEQKLRDGLEEEFG